MRLANRATGDSNNGLTYDLAMDTADPRRARENAEQAMVAAQKTAERAGEAVRGRLTTDDRVLARVTDGIYRQPASALRELISNAWDADAKNVHIQTDAPRFDKITVSDDGRGMNWQTLARLLHHIGGSSKRQKAGAKLGVTQNDDYELSPGGRPLIGKIGIGLYSIAQLTRSFRIITKETGSEYWNIAAVRLHTHKDTASNKADDDTYEAGTYEVWRERTAEISASGTNIILDGIWPQTRETLRSSELWARYREAADQGETKSLPALPTFNIGTMRPNSAELLDERGQNLPWNKSSEPSERIDNFIQSMNDLYLTGKENNPRIESACDYYLQMIWQLSNWSPVQYVGQHPLNIAPESEARIFELESDGPVEIESDTNNPVSKSLTFYSMLEKDKRYLEVESFHAYLDDVELKRPVSFKDEISTSAALQTPLMFFGTGGTDFPNMEESISGGPLRFYAYFRWVPKLIPVENRGLMVRVQNASGKDYDPTFLGFPVNEQRRLEQITAEIFVVQGLDGALNIDRESYNSSHPHVVYLTRWVHRELRKIIAKQKQLGAGARKSRRNESESQTFQAIENAVQLIRESKLGTGESEPIDIEFISRSVNQHRPDAPYVFDRDTVLGGHQPDARSLILERQMKGIVELLELFNVLEHLSTAESESLLAGIRRIITLEVDGA